MVEDNCYMSIYETLGKSHNLRLTLLNAFRYCSFKKICNCFNGMVIKSKEHDVDLFAELTQSDIY